MDQKASKATRSKRKREAASLDDEITVKKKTKQEDSGELKKAEGPSVTHPSRFSGFVQMPYWSRAADMESDRLRHSVPAYHFKHSGKERQVPPVDRCSFCDLNTAGLAGKRTAQFVSASFATRNPQGVFHQCSFFVEDLADRFLGTRLSLNKNTSCSSFVLAKRPPPVAVVVKEAQDVDAAKDSAVPKKVDAPVLDSHGRLVFLNVQSLTQIRTQLSQDSDETASQILTPHKGASPSLIGENRTAYFIPCIFAHRQMFSHRGLHRKADRRQHGDVVR